MTIDQSRAAVPWEPFALMDRLDDQAIMAELRGGSLKELIYSFEQDGRKVVGLSKEGVDNACRELAKQGEVIREIDLRVEREEDEVYVSVLAARFAVSKEGKEIELDSGWGVKRQPKKMRIYTRDSFGKIVHNEDGSPKVQHIEDPFYYEKAVGKAARNARRRMIPESLIASIIESATSEGRVRQVGPRQGQQRAPTAASQARQEEQATQEEPTAQAETEGPTPAEAPVAEPEESPEAPPPTEPQDITPEEFSVGVKELGFETKKGMYTALGVRNLKDLKRKATTASPLREALEKLKTRASERDESPEDSDLDL